MRTFSARTEVNSISVGTGVGAGAGVGVVRGTFESEITQVWSTHMQRWFGPTNGPSVDESALETHLPLVTKQLEETRQYGFPASEGVVGSAVEYAYVGIAVVPGACVAVAIMLGAGVPAAGVGVDSVVIGVGPGDWGDPVHPTSKNAGIIKINRKIALFISLPHP